MGKALFLYFLLFFLISCSDNSPSPHPLSPANQTAEVPPNTNPNVQEPVGILIENPEIQFSSSSSIDNFQSSFSSATIPIDTTIDNAAVENGAFNQDSVILDYPILQDSAFFANKLSSSNLKIIFRDDDANFLVLVQINGSKIQTDTIRMDPEIHAPQFSPDGNKLAFATALEGTSKPSELYVMDLETKDIQRLDVPKAAVPRWKVPEKGDTSIVYVDYTGNDISPEWKSSKTFIVPFVNGNFGTPQTLFNRSYNGGVSLDNSFTVTGSNKLLLHKTEWESDNDIDLYDGQQVCNVSLARDSSRIFSFLETNGDKGKNFVGTTFLWHSYIFYMNESGDIEKAIKSLDNTVFNYPEWINIPNFQVGTAMNYFNYENQLVIIDYLNSEVFPILKGDSTTQIWEPDIWVEH